MKVFLISSNLYSQFPAVYPNAVGALTSYLRREGHTVANLHMARRRDMKRLAGLLRDFQPDVVGVSVYTCETPILDPVVRIVRAYSPTVPLLAGGIHAVVDPESVLDLPGIDAVCTGEGEESFAEYLRRLEKGEDVTGTPTFLFRKDGALVRNPPTAFLQDLDALPLMDRTVADLQEVIDANNGTINLIFSRGCPWNCMFCSNRILKKGNTGNYARLRGVPSIMTELEALHAKYRFRHITFRDDTFTWNREWALELVREYRKRFKTPFDIFSRVDTLDPEMMDELKASGCQHIFLGLDSGNDEIRNTVLHKEQSNEDLYKVTDYMFQIGLIPMISNIVGLPYETYQQHLDTIAVNKRVHRRPVFSPTAGACPKIWVFTPWPGSDLYRLAVKEGWMKPRAQLKKVYRESVLEMPQFPPRDIDRAFRRFRYEVYKDTFPIHAVLYRIYDSKPVQLLFERIPLELIGMVRLSLLTMLVPERRLAALRGLFRRNAPFGH